MNESNMVWDYVFVGAGIFGVSAAKSLLERKPNSKILLIDKYSASGQGNTVKSNACYRNVFETDINIKLCNSSIDYYKFVENHEKTDLGLKDIGYLWLLTKEQMDSRDVKSISINNQDSRISLLEFLKLNQVEYTVFTKDQLNQMFPLLKTTFDTDFNDDEINIPRKNIEFGFLGKNCGTLSPDLLVRHYESQYRELGGNCLYDTEVIELLLKEKGEPYDEDFFPAVWRDLELGGLRVRNTRTDEITTIQSKNYILTTGAWVNQLLEPLGVRTTIKPKKRQLFRILNMDLLVKNSNFDNRFNTFPFIILPVSGVFMKPNPEGMSIDVGVADDIGRRFETRVPDGIPKNTLENPLLDNPIGEMDFYLTNVLPILNQYFPSAIDETSKIEKPSAGMYAYSIDKSPVIEHVEALGNLFFSSGGSGSGIMKADSMGRILSSLILGEKEAILYNKSKVNVSDFTLSKRNLPKETLVL
ncbi:MAG: FAD-binding oxidoreductase [Candidatus Heimdallarchaeota archaeon]|nr:FAD-binding oxidoreductase [Candidatus Heimdallarchaeota archaeon]